MSAAPKKGVDTSKKAAAKSPGAKAKSSSARRTAGIKKSAKAVPELELHDLRPPKGATKNKRRLGQGPGSGRGGTSGRGHKGQKSRSGYSRRHGFEGGQMPLHRRVPKHGFTNIFRTEYAEVNVGRRLAALAGEKEITPELLLERRVVRKIKDGVKVLGHGEIKKALTVRAHAFSAAAREKIEKAGGKAEVIKK